MPTMKLPYTNFLKDSDLIRRGPWKKQKSPLKGHLFALSPWCYGYTIAFFRFAMTRITRGGTHSALYLIFCLMLIRVFRQPNQRSSFLSPSTCTPQLPSWYAVG